jgi:hypothetical protein
MKEAKKSRRSQRSRNAIRVLLAIVPLPFALSLALPELGGLLVENILIAFSLGLLIGTFTHIYWIRALLKEREFYLRFYKESALKPHKNDLAMHKKHSRVLFPFYIMGLLMFILVIFAFGILGFDFHYALPLVIGALQGIPISYTLLERGLIHPFS